VDDFFTIYVTIIWRNGWRITTFTYPNFCCRVDFQ